MGLINLGKTEETGPNKMIIRIEETNGKLTDLKVDKCEIEGNLVIGKDYDNENRITRRVIIPMKRLVHIVDKL